MEVDPAPQETPISTLYVLQLIKDAQQQHGLRHGDYQRYRGYCARRINRVRKAVKYNNVHKCVPKHRAKYVPKPITADVVSDVKFLDVLVFETERTWAYAMELKYDAVDDPLSRKKFHMRNKLRRAVKHANNLELIAKNIDSLDTTTRLEIQAYNAFISASFYLELQQWGNAGDLYRTAKTIYEKLATVVVMPELVELYKARCFEIQKTLKLCEYNSGRFEAPINELIELSVGGTHDLNAEFDKLIREVQTRTSASDYKTITWGGLTAPVSHSRVKNVLDASSNLSEQLRQTQDLDAQLTLYETFLSEVRDASQKIGEENRKAAADSTGHELNSIQITLAYLDFLRLTRGSERYLLMVTQLKQASDGEKRVRPQDFLRLYAQVIENSNDIIRLPGAANDDALIQAQTFKAEFYQAYKTHYMASAYASFSQYAKANALFDRAAERQKQAAAQLANLKGNSYITETAADLDELASLIHTAKISSLANRISDAAGEEEVAEVQQNLPLYEIAENWAAPSVEALKAPDASVSLVPTPPRLQPMPVKPVFFDLAINHVKMPDLRPRVQQLIEKEQASTQQQAAAAAAKQTSGGPSKPNKKQKAKAAAAAAAAAEQSNADDQGGFGSYVKGFFWGGR